LNKTTNPITNGEALDTLPGDLMTRNDREQEVTSINGTTFTPTAQTTGQYYQPLQYYRMAYENAEGKANNSYFARRDAVGQDINHIADSLLDNNYTSKGDINRAVGYITTLMGTTEGASIFAPGSNYDNSHILSKLGQLGFTSDEIDNITGNAFASETTNPGMPASYRQDSVAKEPEQVHTSQSANVSQSH
jgi:hypothetical protein